MEGLSGKSNKLLPVEVDVVKTPAPPAPFVPIPYPKLTPKGKKDLKKVKKTTKKTVKKAKKTTKKASKTTTSSLKRGIKSYKKIAKKITKKKK